VIDLHCHLDLYPDPHAVAKECARRQLYVLSVTTTPTAFEGTRRLAPAGSKIRTALGLHPEIAVQRRHELELIERLLPLTDYVGEIGLDGSRDHRATLDAQSEIFRSILVMCAQAGGRKLTIHSRAAAARVLDVLHDVPGAGSFVLHWFVGTPAQVSRATAMSAWFSVGPTMLSSERGRVAANAMPRDRILTESDGPFGTVNGDPAYPWDAWKAVPHLAALWEVTEQEAADQLTSNFRTFVEA
jgi:TatD DNase family protein